MGGKSSKTKEEKEEKKKQRKSTRRPSFRNLRKSKKVEEEYDDEKSVSVKEPPSSSPPSKNPSQNLQLNVVPRPSFEEATTMPTLEFHAQIVQQEIKTREDELKQFTSKKAVCDVFEENPFKKGVCRNCKNPQAEHRDAFADILDDLANV